MSARDIVKRNTINSVSRRKTLKRGALVTGGLVGLVGPATANPGRGRGQGNKCDIHVPDDHSTIQAAVDVASPDDTICIEGGTYDEDVQVDVPVTLQGRPAPVSNNPALLDGQLTIQESGAGTMVRRLRITASDTFLGGAFPDPAGVLVRASNVLIENNVIEGFHADLNNGQGTFSLHGIQVFGKTSLTDITIRRNLIRGFLSEGDSTTWPKYGGIAGVKLQADVSNATVTGNQITDNHSAGWVYGIVLTGSGSASGHPTNVVVEENSMNGLNDGSEFDVFSGGNDGRDTAPYPGSAFGIDEGARADEATVRQNNLLAPNGAENKDEETALSAQCNWWGAKSGPTDDDNSDGTGSWALERGGATIESTPWLIAPAPSNACRGGNRPT